MTDYVVYHKAEKMGYPALDISNLAIYTRKPTEGKNGSRVWWNNRGQTTVSQVLNWHKVKGIRVPAKEDVDLFLRILGAFLGLMFLMGALWVSRDGRYLNIAALCSATAMFVCVISPARPSPVAFVALTISAALAGFDFFSRALPSLRVEGYPPDIVIFYLSELVVIVWFFTRHLDAFFGKIKKL